MIDVWDARATWIWHPCYDDSRNPGSIVLFRHKFNLSNVPSHFTINVSADSRYRLFLNGHRISVGPCKGTPQHWNYETVEVPQFLRIGDNVLAAQVMRYSPAHRGNTSIMRTTQPGFILLAEGQDVSIATDLSWRCVEDISVKFLGESELDSFLSINETVTGSLRQLDWQLNDFDDSTWMTPIIIENDSPVKEVSTLPWNLQPRQIPQLTEIPKRFKDVVQVILFPSNTTAKTVEHEWNMLLSTGQALRIPPYSQVEVDIQAAEYSTGYLEFGFSGGRGAIVTHKSAESYEIQRRPPWEDSNKTLKGVRTDFKNGHLNAPDDIYIVAGLAKEPYEPFWFRTFRFIRLNIKTLDEFLTITNLSYRETNFPLTVRSYFHSSSQEFSKFWDVSLRTLKNCMHETYEDCPYYEQSQFAFDTRSQMLFTYNISGDDRLARKALHDFHTSMRPDGTIAMRYPAHTNVLLPVFSLFYPLMVHDHVLYYGDMALAKRYFPSCDAILSHFDRLVRPDGLVGRFDPRCWSYVDWVKDWVFATPPSARTSCATYFSLVYALSLGITAEVAEFLTRPGLAAEYLTRKQVVLKSVNKLCFDGTWYYDGPLSATKGTPGSLSQHCQIYAVLSGAIEGDAARDLVVRTMKDKTLHQMSLSQSFYLFRALEKVQLYHTSDSLWESWRTMLSQGLDTWPENLHDPRSDCHAWSAVPLYEFPCGILGIKPSSPGFQSTTIEPRLALLDEADGTIMTPKGEIRVSWTSPENFFRRVEVETPKGIVVNLNLSGDYGTNVFHGGEKIVVTVSLN